ncbi:MAG TPA: hypothetical protein PLU30_15450 [Verrucomicrobiae bacterium]|nr:hypothetical protein [Verrucomicrobiae bacterium]
MKSSLEHYRDQLTDRILTFLWRQWSRIGVAAGTARGGWTVIDPETLLLLTLECARRDPRVFDEVLDWLHTNGRWVNVTRLDSLLAIDKVCTPTLVGAAAATLAESDRTVKWRTLATKHRPATAAQPTPLFDLGPASSTINADADAIWLRYGWSRPAFKRRESSTPILAPEPRVISPASLFFKARAIFGVNIRADVFVFAALRPNGVNANEAARELGYSQRRVHDAMSEMALGGLLTIVQEGRGRGSTTAYTVARRQANALAVPESAGWFDWRALARAWILRWRKIFTMREERLSPYIIESEVAPLLRAVESDLQRFEERSADQPPVEPTPAGTTISVGDRKERTAARIVYGWKRYWRRQGENSRDPDRVSLFEQASNVPRDTATLGQYANTPCLVLLGAPGMGKSHELNRAKENLERQVGHADDRVMFVDLASCDGSEWLERTVFDTEPFRSWSQGKCHLHLFLDSLDTGRLHTSALAALLADRLKELPSVDGLYFRIACRTVEWPPVLAECLLRKWGPEGVATIELMPLQKRDVIETADANGLDGERFLEQIEQRQALPLALKPITLDFLLKTFQRDASLPTSQRELYEEGCRRLCEEPTRGRFGAHLTGRLAPAQRLEVAKHLAAATILCNRAAIWLGPGEAPANDVSIDDLCATQPPGCTIPWDSAAIRETLDTALFSSQGPDRVGWDHQTYGEFLAAGWLSNSGLTHEQVWSLLAPPADGSRKLIPQLRETAAWLAGCDSNVFRAIKASDPYALLHSDVTTASPEDRASLIDALLTLAGNQGAPSGPWDHIDLLPKLNHPTIASRLRAWIMERRRDEHARIEAIAIARACDVKQLASDLALVALDSAEAHRIRWIAAHACGRLADDATLVRLKPLVNLTRDSDPDNQIKGEVLKACWPRVMTVAEVFSVLEPPVPHVFGGYRYFIAHEFIPKLPPSDLPAALDWVAQQNLLNTTFDKIFSIIVTNALDHIDEPKLLESFASAYASLLKQNAGEFAFRRHEWTARLRENTAFRRRIFPLVLDRLLDSPNDIELLSISSAPLIDQDDFLWLATQLEHAGSPALRAGVATVMRRVFDWTDPEHVDRLITAAHRHPEIKERFSHWLATVNLQSDEAARQRKAHLEDQEWQKKIGERTARARIEPPPKERIAILLDRFERGEHDTWWRLTQELTLEETSTYDGCDDDDDITVTPGWRDADRITRQRIVDAAWRYVHARDAAQVEWFNKTGTFSWPAVGGFRALYLLHKQTPDLFQSLPPEVWRRWMPIIVAHPKFGDPQTHVVLTQHAYKADPTAVKDWLLRYIDRENEADRGFDKTTELEAIVDEPLAEALLEKVRSPKIKASVSQPILRLLMEKGGPGVAALCREWLRLPLSTEAEDRKRAVCAARLLLQRAPDGGWTAIWPAIVQDSSFGRELFEEVAYEAFSHPAEVVRGLPEREIEDLYVWLVAQYPPSSDPKIELGVAPFIDKREAVATFRDQLLSHLADRGTRAATATISRLVMRFPEHKSMRFLLARAEENMRRNTWSAPSLANLFALVSHSRRRLVESEAELLSVVIESLNHLQGELHGESARAQFLWNHPWEENATPKHETELSDFIRCYLVDDLERRGIVANREVEIRPGAKPDILITALPDKKGGPGTAFNVVLEVKGCWHREIETAIETQLVDRYLPRNLSRHGLYVVVCFSREKHLDALRMMLERKSDAMSRDGITVRSIVLDASLPERGSQRKGKRTQKGTRASRTTGTSDRS